MGPRGDGSTWGWVHAGSVDRPAVFRCSAPKLFRATQGFHSHTTLRICDHGQMYAWKKGTTKKGIRWNKEEADMWVLSISTAVAS